MTLKEAELLAIKSIKKFLGNRYLTDDNIAYVIEYLLLAESRYDPTKGTKLTSWLFNYSKGACSHIKRSYNSKKRKMLLTNNEDYFLNNIEEDETQVVDNSVIEFIKEQLDSRQQIVLQRIYVDGVSVEECAKELDYSKQHIYNILGQINTTIKNKFHNKEFLKSRAEK